jgi:hypothetical protein
MPKKTKGSSWYSTRPGDGGSDIELWEAAVVLIECSRCGEFETPANLEPACPECGANKLFEEEQLKCIPKKRIGRTRRHWREVEPKVVTIKVEESWGLCWWYWHCQPGCLPDSTVFGPYRNEREALCDALRDMSPIPVKLKDSDDFESRGMVYISMEFPGAGAVGDNDQYVAGSTWEEVDENYCYTSLCDYKGLVEELEKGDYEVDQSAYTPTTYVERGSVWLVEKELEDGWTAVYGMNTDEALKADDRIVYLGRIKSSDGLPSELPDGEDLDKLAFDEGVVLVPFYDQIEDDPCLVFPDVSRI